MWYNEIQCSKNSKSSINRQQDCRQYLFHTDLAAGYDRKEYHDLCD